MSGWGIWINLPLFGRELLLLLWLLILIFLRWQHRWVTLTQRLFDVHCLCRLRSVWAWWACVIGSTVCCVCEETWKCQGLSKMSVTPTRLVVSVMSSVVFVPQKIYRTVIDMNLMELQRVTCTHGIVLFSSLSLCCSGMHVDTQCAMSPPSLLQWVWKFWGYSIVWSTTEQLDEQNQLLSSQLPNFQLTYRG